VREVGGSGISRPWILAGKNRAEVSLLPRERARAPADGKIRPRRAPPEPGSEKMNPRSMRREPGERGANGPRRPGSQAGQAYQTRRNGSGGLGRPFLVHIKHTLSLSLTISDKLALDGKMGHEMFVWTLNWNLSHRQSVEKTFFHQSPFPAVGCRSNDPSNRPYRVILFLAS
jgi:hypothetical protein